MLSRNAGYRMKMDRCKRSTKLALEHLEYRTLLADVSNIGAYVIEKTCNTNLADIEQVTHLQSSDRAHSPMACPRETARPSTENADAIFARDETWLPSLPANDVANSSDEKLQEGADASSNEEPIEGSPANDANIIKIDEKNDIATGVNHGEGTVPKASIPNSAYAADIDPVQPLINPPTLFNEGGAMIRNAPRPDALGTSRSRTGEFEYFTSAVETGDTIEPLLSSQPLAREMQHDTFMAMTLLERQTSTHVLVDKSQSTLTTTQGSRSSKLPEIGDATKGRFVDSRFSSASSNVIGDSSGGTLIPFASPASVYDTSNAVTSLTATARRRVGRDFLRVDAINSDPDSKGHEQLVDSDSLMPGFQMAALALLSAIVAARPAKNGQATDEPADVCMSKRTTPFNRLASTIFPG